MKSINNFLKKNDFVHEVCLIIIMYIYIVYYLFFMTIFRIFRINNKKIMILNYYGKGYGDMGKYIAKELLNEDCVIYWAVKKKYKDSLPDKVKCVRYESIRYLFHLSTSKIWINNCRFRKGTIKRKKQFYIQTWHGCIGYKRCEKAVVNVLHTNYIKSCISDSKMADLFVSNSEFCTRNYKDNFWYNGEIIKCGCPRNDIIINQSKSLINDVKKYFNLKQNEKICLYAPTFRANGSLENYSINYEKLIDSLSKKFDGKWIVLVRLHPNISKYSNEFIKYNENIINATDYPDMQELLIAADFLITDYSSCIFDYSISKKPAMIYATDIEEYIKDRDFLINFDKTPFDLAKDNESLFKLIDNYNEKIYKQRVDKFYKKIGLFEPGNSCKTIKKIIKNKIIEG